MSVINYKRIFKIVSSIFYKEKISRSKMIGTLKLNFKEKKKLKEN